MTHTTIGKINEKFLVNFPITSTILLVLPFWSFIQIVSYYVSSVIMSH